MATTLVWPYFLCSKILSPLEVNYCTACYHGNDVGVGTYNRSRVRGEVRGWGQHYIGPMSHIMLVPYIKPHSRYLMNLLFSYCSLPLCVPPSQENSQSIPLVRSTLETLLRFLNWIPLGYIFETKVISLLIYKVGYKYQ